LNAAARAEADQRMSPDSSTTSGGIASAPPKRPGYLRSSVRPVGRPVSQCFGVFHGRSERCSSLVAQPESPWITMHPNRKARSRLTCRQRFIAGHHMVTDLDLAGPPFGQEIGDGCV